MLSGEIGGTPPIETFLADTKTCGDIMRGFRVSSAETPIVAAGRSVVLRTLSRLYTGAQKSMSMRLIILLRCGHFFATLDQVWRQPLCRRQMGHASERPACNSTELWRFCGERAVCRTTSL